MLPGTFAGASAGERRKMTHSKMSRDGGPSDSLASRLSPGARIEVWITASAMMRGHRSLPTTSQSIDTSEELDCVWTSGSQ